MQSRFAPGVSVFSPVEILEQRRLMTASYDIGINMNSSASADVDKASAIMKNLGVETVRVWHSVTDFDNPTMTGSLQRAIDYANKGFNVTLVVHTKDGIVTDPASVKKWFNWAMDNSALKSAVDQWEIGNEPDSYKYWRGSLAQYVSQFLKPSYEVLSASNEDVISGAPSWNPQDVQTMINAGMLNYTDYVGFHPYANGVSGVKLRTQQINDVVAGRKPIAATEWNVRGYENNKTSWAAAVEDAFPIIQGGFDLNYYFAMKTQDSLAGPGGILTSSLAYNQPFFNAFATFAGNLPGDDDDETGGGNTPAANTGTISGVLFNDLSPANGIYDGADTITGSRVVYIDANANGKLDAGEKSTVSSANGTYTFTGLAAGSYNVTRVFPKGYKLSNNEKGYVTVNVAAKQAVGDVNLGSVTTTPVVPTEPTTPTVPTEPTTPTTPTEPTTPTIPTVPTTPVDQSTAVVTGFVIVNALTDQVIGSLPVIDGNVTIPYLLLPKTGVNIKVVTTDATGSVKITALGKTIIENNKPFSVFGDFWGDYKVWAPNRGSSYTVSATAFEGVGATGTKGNTLTATITFA